jgi:uncharacterized membrane protein YfcA
MIPDLKEFIYFEKDKLVPVELFIIVVTAFLAAVLTFFSGFGLGTLLTPVFMLFFPVDVAIALTGVVHFFNNIFKLILVGRNADKAVLLRFGIPAVIGALLGSLLLVSIPDVKPLFSYQLGERLVEVYPVKFIISILLILFASMDIVPALKNLQFPRDRLPVGGALSGFFGGLSGNQGELRSAFLIRAGLSKEAFIGTAVVVSTFVDLTRLGIYSIRFSSAGLDAHIGLVLAATGSAMAGAFLGNRLLKKVTVDFIQKLVAVLLILLSVALGAGLI